VSKIQGKYTGNDLKFFHTEPHHDDIMLGYLPYILRSRSSDLGKDVFVCCTSGFNSVSNKFLLDLVSVCRRIVLGELSSDLVSWPIVKEAIWLDCETSEDLESFIQGDLKLGIACRFLKNFCMRGWSNDHVVQQLNELETFLTSLYPGQKHPDRPDIESIKGGCREFESDCLWYSLGWKNINSRHHLRMGFYTSDIFAPQPEFERDSAPILSLLLREEPDVVTVALDPEGSGPDTHYKVLQAITAALVEYENVTGKHPIVWGYRNVWYTFDLAEADIIIPVNDHEIERMHSLFMSCYQTQRTAEFPSYQLDGPFSKIVENQLRSQFEDVMKCLCPTNGSGEEKVKCLDSIGLPPDTTGLMYIKELSVYELMKYSRSLRQSVENF
jgi:glucosamine-6-phosphate deaminase